MTALKITVVVVFCFGRSYRWIGHTNDYYFNTYSLKLEEKTRTIYEILLLLLFAQRRMPLSF